MNIVKELRRKAGIQQKELAIVVGVAQPTISEWERGKKDPSGRNLKKLAEYFGVDELMILGRGMVGLSGKPEIYTVTPGDAVPVSTYPAPPAPVRMEPDFDKAATKAVETLIKYHVSAVPVSPIHLLQAMGVFVVTFTEMADRTGLDRKNQAIFFGAESQDAVSFAVDSEGAQTYMVAYNQNLPADMVHRALCREMGRIVLEHDPTIPLDVRTEEALCFARHLLCPRPLIRAIQETGVRATVKTIGNITGCYGRYIAGMRKTPGASVSAELNRLCRAQFAGYLQIMISRQAIMVNEDDSDAAVFGSYMDGYEE